MPTATIQRTINIGGTLMSGSTSRTEGAVELHEVTLAAGKAGAISSATYGVDGLPTGHGIEALDVVDIHWLDSEGVHKCRYGLTVDTANANDIEFDETPEGAGDALPAENTAVFVCVQQVIAADVNMANAKLVAISSTQNAHVAFTNDDPATMFGQKLTATVPWLWNDGEGVSNPFDDTDDDVLATLKCSNGSATAATFKIGILFDDEA